MYCVKCGNQLLPEARFCTSCGDAISLVNEGNKSPIPSGNIDQQTQSQHDVVNFQSVRLLIGLTALVLLSGIAYWYFIERNNVREPKYTVGDSWQFAITERRLKQGHLSQNAPNDVAFEARSDITFKVAHVSQDGSLVTTISDFIIKHDMIFQGVVTDANGQATDRDEKNISFPVYPGKTWESSKDWLSGKFKTRVNRAYAVENWETVTVPAGTFRALPIKRTNKQRGYLSATGEEVANMDSTSISWFSPDVKNSVKSIESTSIGTTTWELKSFSLN